MLELMMLDMKRIPGIDERFMDKDWYNAHLEGKLGLSHMAILRVAS